MATGKATPESEAFRQLAENTIREICKVNANK